MTKTLAASASLVIAFLTPVFAQTPGRDVRPAANPNATGRIAGTVVDAESGSPVRFAGVDLVSSTGAIERKTDDAGAFSFDGLPAGSYSVRISKPGYLETKYGQTRPGTETPGRQIRLQTGEQIERLVIPLSHGGSIAGVVRDDRGDPAYDARVRVMRWVMRGGIRKLETVSSTQTDERGRYRISLLPPRDYIVSAMPEQDDAESSESGAVRPRGFASVYFPAALSPQGAAVLEIGLGDQRTDIDLQLPLVPLGRITGVVLNADGQPVHDVRVSARDRDHPDFEQNATTDEAGRFSIDRLIPGPYLVQAGERNRYGDMKVVFRNVTLMVGGKGNTTTTTTLPKFSNLHSVVAAEESTRSDTPESKTEMGTASDEVVVASGATSEVTLTLQPPRRVSGRLRFDGASPRPPLSELRLMMTSQGDGEDVTARINDDGTFTVPDVVPGRYIVSLTGETDGWEIGSAIYAGVDALDHLLEIARDRDVHDLAVTLRDSGAELRGTVTDAQSRPVADRLVIVFADDEGLWTAGTNRVQTSMLTADGTFSFGRLRPGTYRLAVTEDAEPDEWLNPAFLRKLLAASVVVRISENEKKVQDLRIR